MALNLAINLAINLATIGADIVVGDVAVVLVDRQVVDVAYGAIDDGARQRAAGGVGFRLAAAMDDGAAPAARCALARAVIDGTVRHVNDLPIDRHDRDVATNDIRAYCR